MVKITVGQKNVRFCGNSLIISQLMRFILHVSMRHFSTSVFSISLLLKTKTGIDYAYFNAYFIYVCFFYTNSNRKKKLFTVNFKHIQRGSLHLSSPPQLLISKLFNDSKRIEKVM